MSEYHVADAVDVVAPVSADITPQRTPGFGLGLLLLSALGMVTSLTIAVMVSWRIGATLLVTMIVVLSAFLLWEMRSHAARQAEHARRQTGPFAVSGSNSH